MKFGDKTQNENQGKDKRKQGMDLRLEDSCCSLLDPKKPISFAMKTHKNKVRTPRNNSTQKDQK